MNFNFLDLCFATLAATIYDWEDISDMAIDVTESVLSDFKAIAAESRVRYIVDNRVAIRNATCICYHTKWDLTIS